MQESDEDLKKYVEMGDGIHVIRGSGDCRGWNGIRYKAGISREERRLDQTVR